MSAVVELTGLMLVHLASTAIESQANEHTEDIQSFLNWEWIMSYWLKSIFDH